MNNKFHRLKLISSTMISSCLFQKNTSHFLRERLKLVSQGKSSALTKAICPGSVLLLRSRVILLYSCLILLHSSVILLRSGLILLHSCLILLRSCVILLCSSEILTQRCNTTMKRCTTSTTTKLYLYAAV